MTDDYTAFSQDCAALLETLQTLQQQGVKETVCEESAFISQYILKELQMNQLGDAFLFAAAVNTLNAFVRDDENNRNRIGDMYKTAPGELCVYLSDHPECGMVIELHEENGKNMMYTEICQIQFSYGRIALDERTGPFYIPDPENQKLRADDLYERNLSETILAFALDNTRLRAGVCGDGKDFADALDKALELYRSGKLSLEDLVDHEQQLADLSTQLSAFFQQMNAVLYETTYAQFHQTIVERSFMPFIAQNFEKNLGYPMPAALYNQGKYALETLRAIAAEWGEISPEIRTQIGYMRTPAEEHFYLLFSSETDGIPGCAVIQLFGWECVEPADAEDRVRFRYFGEPNFSETIHPALQGILLYEYLKLGCIYDCSHIRMSSFFYESARKPSTEIPSYSGSEQRLFYAPEGRNLMADLADILTGEPVSDSLLIEKPEDWLNCILNSDEDLKLFSQILRAGMKTEPSALFVISWRMSTDTDAVSEALSEALRPLSGATTVLLNGDGEVPEDTQILVHLGYFPAEMDFARNPYQVVIMDEIPGTSQEQERFLILTGELSAGGIPIHAVTMGSALGYSDSGAGFDWLVGLLHLGIPGNLIWDKTRYPIIITDQIIADPEKGIAIVTVPGTVTSERLHRQDWREAPERSILYGELRSGIRGVYLVVEDPSLCLELQRTKDAYCESLDRILAEPAGTEIEEEQGNGPSRSSAAQVRAGEDAEQALGAYAWHLMQKESRDWVVSALVSYSDLMRVSQLLDYSGVNLLLSKAFEIEGQRYLVEGYLNYMYREYGDGYLERLPEELVRQDKYGNLYAVETDHVTLGSFPFIMGFGPDNRIANRTDYDHFASYASDALLREPEDVYGQLQSLATILNRVCLRYRDTAAHSVATDAQRATECVNYCVLEERKLGVMMDLFLPQ